MCLIPFSLFRLKFSLTCKLSVDDLWGCLVLSISNTLKAYSISRSSPADCACSSYDINLGYFSFLTYMRLWEFLESSWRSQTHSTSKENSLIETDSFNFIESYTVIDNVLRSRTQGRGYETAKLYVLDPHFRRLVYFPEASIYSSYITMQVWL